MNRLDASMIEAQAATLSELYREDLPALIRNAAHAEVPGGIRRVYALGNGDSYHAALAARQYFAQWTEIEYLPMPAYTFWSKELPRLAPDWAAEALIVCISASGSSKLAADILIRAGEKGFPTLSLAGRKNCAMDQAARYTLSAGIREKGRSPGIRTFAASLGGLFALACRLSGQAGRMERLAVQLEESAQGIEAILAAARPLAREAAAWDWPHAMVLGCDGLLGCASFAAAKLAEGCGVLAVPQEMEEWCHVESMTYPLNAPVIILQGGAADRAQAIKAAKTARRAGRPVLLWGELPDAELAGCAQQYVCVGPGCEEALLPLFAYLPVLPLACALAERLGRAMFLSDQPFSLF